MLDTFRVQQCNRKCAESQSAIAALGRVNRPNSSLTRTPISHTMTRLTIELDI